MPLDVVFADGLAFHDPFEGGLAVDDVGVGFLGYVADREVAVVEVLVVGRFLVEVEGIMFQQA